MSLIDLEKAKLKEWAKKDGKNILPFFDSTKDSYYYESEDTEVIYEFYYENIPQLKKLLEKKKRVVHDAQMDLVCSVAAFKYRNSIVSQGVEEENRRDKKEMISDFIYNF